MPPPLHRLLCLPPCLRQQSLSPRALDLLRLPCRRSASSTSSSSQSSQVKAAGRSLRARPKVPQSSPSAREIPLQPARFSLPYIDQIEPGSERVLLYAAPGHTTFFFASYLVGASLLIGAYSYAELFLKDTPEAPRKPLVAKALGGAATLFIAVMGTVVLLAPAKTIRSVAIARAATDTPRALRVEVRRALPFLRPDVLFTDPASFVLDRSVPAATANIGFFDVPPTRAREATEQFFAGTWAPQTQGSEQTKKGGIFAALHVALAGVWPAMRRETQRMLLREQMAYVRIEQHGNFKLDLCDCTLLDSGRTLDRLVQRDEVRQSLVGVTRGLFRR